MLDCLGQAVCRVEYGQKDIRGVVVVLSHEVRQLGAAVKKVGSSSAGFNDNLTDAESLDFV